MLHLKLANEMQNNKNISFFGTLRLEGRSSEVKTCEFIVHGVIERFISREGESNSCWGFQV